MIDIETYDFNEHVNNLIEIIRDKIKINKVTILTGDNGTGKSLIRKCLWSGINRQLGITEKKPICADVSMERRTALHSELGGGGVFLRDCEWNPTSVETLGNVKNLIKGGTSTPDYKRFLIVDEPEIGCSRDVQVAVAKYINSFYEDFHNPDKCHGLLVITHSSDIVKTLKHDAFINIQGMTEDEWLNRPIKDIDLDTLEKFSNRLYAEINKHLK